MQMRRAILLAVLVVASISAAVQSGQAAPQQRNPIPDKFTNLQVLPKDIGKGDLVRIMKSFSITMEKRCSFCHVATDDLSQADFALDDKEPKKKARELLKFILETQKKPAPSAGAQ